MFEFDPTLGLAPGTPVTILDESGRRCLVSEQFAAVMRRSRDELLGLPWYTIAHVDDLEIARRTIQAILHQDGPHAMRRKLIRGDGIVFEAVLHAARLPHPKHRGYVIQTNMSVESKLVGSQASDLDRRDLPTDPAALLAEVRRQAAGLAAAVGKHDLRLLQHLLAMASAEATSEMERRGTRSVVERAMKQLALH